MPKLALKLRLFQQISMKVTNMYFTKIPHIFQSSVPVIEKGRSGKEAFVGFFFEREYNIKLN